MQRYAILRKDARAAQAARRLYAAGALWPYLTDAEIWYDKRLPDGSFIEEQAPASYFYRIMAAFEQLSRTLPTLAAGVVQGLSLE